MQRSVKAWLTFFWSITALTINLIHCTTTYYIWIEIQTLLENCECWIWNIKQHILKHNCTYYQSHRLHCSYYILYFDRNTDIIRQLEIQKILFCSINAIPINLIECTTPTTTATTMILLLEQAHEALICDNQVILETRCIIAQIWFPCTNKWRFCPQAKKEKLKDKKTCFETLVD